MWADLTSGGVSSFQHLQAEPTETLGWPLWADGSTQGTGASHLAEEQDNNPTLHLLTHRF